MKTHHELGLDLGRDKAKEEEWRNWDKRASWFIKVCFTIVSLKSTIGDKVVIDS